MLDICFSFISFAGTYFNLYDIVSPILTLVEPHSQTFSLPGISQMEIIQPNKSTLPKFQEKLEKIKNWR